MDDRENTPPSQETWITSSDYDRAVHIIAESAYGREPTAEDLNQAEKLVAVFYSLVDAKLIACPPGE
ncbi:hypothetical protein L3Y19_gp087 [Gordonia phage Neville]|uniref:Uncharacterized protein n=2 Tax=Nevillevirus TaxID=3044773 RepID=A0A515MH51_9CAUD|nr:hypothetical protein L3Y19_gp087 [Gordonia phage Neville]YP_010246075.1 hypothetical protein L3Y20_gp090 [Gordonia phage Trax]AXQ64455.1 hypothetical protein SEA_NEVILLE_87 [Gordonia phage Neville]QDM55977.1 hypothetical protein SEA_TRAX_90 [Gordonia phage Trax]